MSDYPERSMAAVVEEFKAPLVLREIPIPRSLEQGALLVRIEACSMCGTDVHLWQGELSLDVKLPVILGHEMVGRIVAMGSDADRDSVGAALRIGDRVVWEHASCGRCRYCTVDRAPALCSNRRQYMYETCNEFPYVFGGFSQYVYVLPRSGRVRVPDAVPDGYASLASCAFRSVMNAVEQLGSFDRGETAVVQGTGPLGLLALGVFKAAGVRELIAIGAPEERLEVATAFGADAVLSIDEVPQEEDRVAWVRDATDGGADVVLEFTGQPRAFAEGLQMLRKGGRYVVVGQLSEGKTAISPSVITKRNLTIQGSFSGDIGHYWRALRFLEEHRDSLPFHRLLTGEYPLEEVNRALERMSRFEEIKPVLYPWK